MDTPTALPKPSPPPTKTPEHVAAITPVGDVPARANGGTSLVTGVYDEIGVGPVAGPANDCPPSLVRPSLVSRNRPGPSRRPAEDLLAHRDLAGEAEFDPAPRGTEIGVRGRGTQTDLRLRRESLAVRKSGVEASVCRLVGFWC